MRGKNIPNGNRYYDTAVLFLQSGTAEGFPEFAEKGA